MPIRKVKGKWYYGGKGPFDSREKAVEVAAAIHASEETKGLRGLAKKRKKKGK